MGIPHRFVPGDSGMVRRIINPQIRGTVPFTMVIIVKLGIHPKERHRKLLATLAKTGRAIELPEISGRYR